MNFPPRAQEYILLWPWCLSRLKMIHQGSTKREGTQEKSCVTQYLKSLQGWVPAHFIHLNFTILSIMSMVCLIIFLSSTSLFTQYTEKKCTRKLLLALKPVSFKLNDGLSKRWLKKGSSGGQQQIRPLLIYMAFDWNSFVSHCSTH